MAARRGLSDLKSRSAIRDGGSSERFNTLARCRLVSASSPGHVSRMAAAFLVSRYAARQRNDLVALAAPRLWDHLDRPALFFQPGADARDEKVRSPATHQNLSRADARRHGLGPLLSTGNGDRGSPLFHDSS